ncbi:DNA cytosine methyltransferase [Tenacibaculum sp. SZ-18]|uniref:DNA cytosine methyltransferase n=1 Tax=Tenacibaculum sp. SZ-18 TaxID=754423 RepID=UPI000C2D55DD|nr:DNA cytosine methyltransferase [Tenacibaculum sp. SZ-18]
MQKLELFSGTMGFSKGFEEAGFKFDKVYYSEIDKHAIANSKYNRPNAEHIGSVKHFQQWKGKLGRINVLTFGSPCQNFSLAGNRKGLKGRSSSLIHYAIMAIEWFRPDIFIWENVKGAYSSNKGQDFQAIFERLANIDGYRLEKQLLNTSWFLPQNRERIYLIGHLTGRSKPGVFPFGEDDQIFIKPERSKERQSQTKHCTTLKSSGAMKADDTYVQMPSKSGCISGGGNSGGLHSDMTVIPVLTPNRREKRQNGRRFKEDGEPAFTLNCQDQHGIFITSNTKKGYEIATTKDTINFSQPNSQPNSQTRRGRVGKGKAQTLDTACNQGILVQKEVTRGNSQGARIYETSGTSSCLNSGGGGLGAKTGLYDVDNKIRRLTEIECERLQGFPDDWTKFGVYDGVLKEISKTQRYKMLGNAVSVPVVKEIAERLKRIIKLE